MEKPAYKRFLSYIYAYTGEVRMRNTGFAKVEVKNKQCKIGVNLQRITGQGTRPMEVFAFAGEKNADTDRMKYYLLPLGRIYLTGGGGELRCMMEEDAIAGSRFGLADLEGLLIKGNASTNRFLMTLWKEDRVDLEQLLKAKTIEYKQKEEKIKVHPQAPQVQGKEHKEQVLKEQKPEDIDKEEEADKPVDKEIQEVNDKENIVLAELEKEKIEHIDSKQVNKINIENIETTEDIKNKENIEVTENIENKETLNITDLDDSDKSEGLSNLNIKDDREVLHDLLEEQEVKEVLHTHETQVHEAQVHEDEVNDCWQVLCKQFPQMQLQGCCQPLQVLRIGPADLGKLPKKNWAYGSNSFLLQGYCRQKHLILFCCREEQKHCKEPHYYLGVPSTPTGRERMMASMFGFPYYLAAGQNGYWYTEVELRE